MYSPLEVYMKELLQGFCGACSLKDDNARLESVASIIVGNGEYPNHSLITDPHRSCRGTNDVESCTITCRIAPMDNNEALRVHDGTTGALVMMGCDKAILESMKYKIIQLDEKTNQPQASSEPARMVKRGSKDDLTMVSKGRSELGASQIGYTQQGTKRILRRSSSLPLESGELENSSKHNESFDRKVESTRTTIIKNEDVAITSSRKLRGLKVNWQDINPSTNQGKRVYTNPRKLLDTTSEFAGSAPPARPERKMSTEDDSSETLTAVSQDLLDVPTEQLLPGNDKKVDASFPMVNQSLVSCLAQEFQTRPPSSNNDRSIIDSVNNLWAAPKDLSQDVASMSLLSMAKSGTGALSILTHSNESGQADVGQVNDNA